MKPRCQQEGDRQQDSAISKVPANKAARASLAEGLQAKAAAFGGSSMFGEATEKGAGKGQSKGSG